MALAHAVQTCRWGTPTLLLRWPLWYEAPQYEWSCTRGPSPAVLADPAVCRICPFWSPAEHHQQPAPPMAPSDACRYRHALVRRDAIEEGVPPELR